MFRDRIGSFDLFWSSSERKIYEGNEIFKNVWLRDEHAGEDEGYVKEWSI